MSDIAHGKPRRKPLRLPIPDRLHDLAQRVARLGRGCRDPEAFVVEKMTVAREMADLVRELRS